LIEREAVAAPSACGGRLAVCVCFVTGIKHKKIRIFGIFHEIFSKNMQKFKKFSKNPLTKYKFML